MAALEGALRIMPAWQWNVFGHTLALSVFIPALVPLGIVFGGAALWPFIERWITGDHREHHICDRPRNAPTRTAIGTAVITFYGILWLAGGNDIIAYHFHIDLYTTTWVARIAIFAGPVIAYRVTKRICLGLQRKDVALLEHGVETGIIRQLPNGGFTELTRPPSEDLQAVLQARTELQQLVAPNSSPSRPADADSVPAPAARTSIGRLRLALNRVLTENIPVPNTSAGAHGNGRADQLTTATADEAGNPWHEQGGAEYPERKEHRARR
jgi:ubiquinol-cytochrome c reductase cytochrome b subunit